MNGAGFYIASSVFSGMIGGAIGAAAGEGSDHPVLKGALITGLISGALGAVAVALSTEATPQVPGGTVGESLSFGGVPVRFP